MKGYLLSIWPVKFTQRVWYASVFSCTEIIYELQKHRPNPASLNCRFNYRHEGQQVAPENASRHVHATAIIAFQFYRWKFLSRKSWPIRRLDFSSRRHMAPVSLARCEWSARVINLNRTTGNHGQVYARRDELRIVRTRRHYHSTINSLSSPSHSHFVYASSSRMRQLEFL